jgi:hypothetical protein
VLPNMPLQLPVTRLQAGAARQAGSRQRLNGRVTRQRICRREAHAPDT